MLIDCVDMNMEHSTSVLFRNLIIDSLADVRRKLLIKTMHSYRYNCIITILCRIDSREVPNKEINSHIIYSTIPDTWDLQIQLHTGK